MATIHKTPAFNFNEGAAWQVRTALSRWIDTPPPDTMRQPIDIDYVSKAIVGIAYPVLGVVTSFQEQIEWHLRVASLLVGLMVGLLLLLARVA